MVSFIWDPDPSHSFVSCEIIINIPWYDIAWVRTRCQSYVFYVNLYLQRQRCMQKKALYIFTPVTLALNRRILFNI
jgi:hypothetical protein